MAKKVVLHGRGIVEGKCKAEALVSAKPISFLGDVDPATGRIVEKLHDLYGECVKDKVLCFPHGHGSTVGSYVLYSLAKNGLAPKAIINLKADPVIVVGAVIANIPMVDQVDISQIRTGDEVEVDAYKGIVLVSKSREV
jgi:predicted aconitase with swiveling domain